MEQLERKERTDPSSVLAQINRLKRETELSLMEAEKKLSSIRQAAPVAAEMGRPDSRAGSRPTEPEPGQTADRRGSQLRKELLKKRESLDQGLADLEKKSGNPSNRDPQRSIGSSFRKKSQNLNLKLKSNSNEEWVSLGIEQLEDQKAALARTIFNDRQEPNKWNEFKLNSLRNSIVSVSSNENNNPLHSPKQGLPMPGKQQASSRFEGSDGKSVTSIRSRGLKVDDNVILQLSTPVRVHRVGEEKAVAGPQPQQPLPEKKTSCPELPFDSARNEGDPGETNSGRQGSLSSQLKLQLRNLSECLSKDRAIAAESKGRDIDWVQDLSADVPSAEKLDEASVMPVENESVYSPDTISHKISEYSERKLGFKPARLSNFEGLTIEIETPDPEPSHSALLEKIKSPPELSLRQLGSPKEIGKKIAREMSMKAAEFNAELITSEVMTLLFDELMMDGFVLRELFKLQMESTPRGIKTNIRAVKRYLAKLCEYIKGSLPLTQTRSRLTS